jgi:hypothetical protein
MKNNITAEKFRKILLKEKGRISENDLMIEFAKLHVTAALKKASEESYVDNNHHQGDYFDSDNFEVNKDSILNAYDLNNIK